MCACVCDIHGRVCTRVIPDGRHPVRETRKTQPYTEREYLNGWEIGFYGWPPGLTSKKPAVWIAKEPGHPTKSPSDLMWEEMAAKQQAYLDTKPRFSEDQQPKQDGGGI